MMNIYIVQAIGGGEIVLECDKNDLVKTIKEKVAKRRKIPARSVILIFNGRQLDEGLTMEEAGIYDNSKLYLVTRTTGGCIKSSNC